MDSTIVFHKEVCWCHKVLSKKLLIFYKKKAKVNWKWSSCCSSFPPACDCDFLEAAAPRRPEADDQNQLNTFFFPNQSHVSPPPSPSSHPRPSLVNQWPRSLEPQAEYWSRWLSNWWKRREVRPWCCYRTLYPHKTSHLVRQLDFNGLQ